MANNCFDRHGKGRMAKKLALKLSITKKKAYEITVALLEIMGDTLVEESRLELRGFGSFRVRGGNPRKRRNPRTGEQIGSMPAKIRPWFKPSKFLVEKLNENKTTLPTNCEHLLHNSQRQENNVQKGQGLQKGGAGEIAAAYLYG